MISKQNAKGVKIFNWKDKRNVLTLSTIPEHSGELVPSGRRTRTNAEILKPSSVLDYNAAKKGVDMSDQLTSSHHTVQLSGEVQNGTVKLPLNCSQALQL